MEWSELAVCAFCVTKGLHRGRSFGQLEAVALAFCFGWHVRQSPERGGRANCVDQRAARAVVVQDDGGGVWEKGGGMDSSPSSQGTQFAIGLLFLTPFLQHGDDRAALAEAGTDSGASLPSAH